MVNKVRVNIAGAQYAFATTDSEKYITSLADKLDRDIAKLMDVSQSAVSHQLRVLKGSKLVKFRREGKTLFYSLADDHVVGILSQGMEHILEGPENQ